MIIKRHKEQKSYSSDVCGILTEVLNTADVQNVSIIVADNIKPSKGHFHIISTEVYWVYRGKISLKFYEENKQDRPIIDLKEGDLVVIGPKTHHKVEKATKKNRLIVISNPRWTKKDEIISDVIPK